MPKFSLNSINYIVTGNRQKILNVDFTDKDRPGYGTDVSFFTDNEAGTYESAPPSFSYDSQSKKNRNEHGFVFLNEPTTTIRALYDAKDVALKSSVAEQITNKQFQRNETRDTTNIEMYFPHLKQDPLGFVQLNQYSYGMTDKTVVGPVIRRTDLFESKNLLSSEDALESFGNPIWKYYFNPYDKYGSDIHDPGIIENLIPTYLYTPLSNLQNVLFNILSDEYADILSVASISAQTLSSINLMVNENTSSYYAFLNFFKDKSNDVLSNLFKPVWNFENIDHNYIMEVPLQKAATTDNQYHFGTVNADMIMAKNVYDDIYDTNVSAIGDFKRVREYQGINTVGGKLFLTYFDDKEFLAKSSLSSDLNYTDYDKSGPSNVIMSKETVEKERDYMKIECIDAINRFVSLTSHKANLYSARVYGVNKLLEDEKFDWPGNKDAYRENIKQDIRNSIRRIVKNFAPAHTQYYDVVDFDASEPQEQNC